MEDEFFFSLLRISVAQILKALGFDKCKPSVLNIVTDLYIKHLQLVLGKAQKFALARTNCSNTIDVPDVLQAFLAAGTVKPLRFGSIHSKDEIDDSNTRSGEAFYKWLKYSDQYTVSKKLSEVPSSLIHNLMEKRRIDTSAETDQERKKRRLKERQDFYNQLKQGEDVNQIEAMGRYVDELDEDEISADDRLSWLTYLAEKDLKLGHNLKFVNSCIQDSLISIHNNPKFHPTSKDGEQALSLFHNHIVNNTKNDHIILQIHDVDTPQDEEIQTTLAPSQQLKEYLPYNVKYNLVLCDDSLDQYITYASAHAEEIEERLKTFETVDAMDVDSSAEVADSNVNSKDTEVPMGADKIDGSRADHKKPTNTPCTGRSNNGLEPESEKDSEAKEEGTTLETEPNSNDLKGDKVNTGENDQETNKGLVASEPLIDTELLPEVSQATGTQKEVEADSTGVHAESDIAIKEEIQRGADGDTLVRSDENGGDEDMSPIKKEEQVEDGSKEDKIGKELDKKQADVEIEEKKA